MNRFPTWSRWAIAAGVVAVLGAVGGPFVYIHYIEGPAPAPLSVDAGGSSSPTASASATPSASSSSPSDSPSGSSSGSSSDPSSGLVDGTWTVASGSTAGYRVHETLFGQSNTAVGRTTAITGSLTVSGDTVTAGSFSADLTTVASDRAQRDGQFQGRIMNTSTYPTATFTLTKSINLGSDPAVGVTVTRDVTGDLTLHGTTRSVTFTASLKKTGSTVAASGSIPIVFADYNISNPSFGGVVTTDDHGTLEFLLNFTHG